jgi:hypothetical protein
MYILLEAIILYNPDPRLGLMDKWEISWTEKIDKSIDHSWLSALDLELGVLLC